MKFCFLVLIFLPTYLVFAQEPNSEEKIKELTVKVSQSKAAEKLKWMDSLSNVIVNETDFANDSIVQETVKYALELDSMRIATWQTANLIFFENNRSGHPAKGKQIFIDFLENAEQTNNDHALAKYYIEGGDSYFFTEKFEEAIRYYDIAQEYAIKANNDRLEGLSKLYKGATLTFNGDFPEASRTLQEASKIFERSKDTLNFISVKNSLSILYSQNAFYAEAAMERNEGIAIAIEKKSYRHLTSFYFNAASDLRKQENYSEQVVFLKKAIEANKKTPAPDVYIPMMYSSLIVGYAKQDSLSLARMWLSKLEENPEKYTEGSNRDSYLFGLKNVSLGEENYQKAAKEGEEHLKMLKIGSNYEEIKFAEEFLSNVYDKSGDNELAYEHYRNYTAIRDSVNSVQKIKALSYYQTLYETEKRDATILNQKKDIVLFNTNSKIKNQWMLIGALGLISFFGIVLLMRSRNTAKRRQKTQEEFSRNLIQAKEDEVTRLARELHDSVGQKLMLLTKQTKDYGEPKMELLARNALDELRGISRNLHPATLNSLGISRAIEALVNEVDSYSTILFTNEIENIDAFLPKNKALHLYRIVQEVLTNMVKHSEAKSASVVLQNMENVINVVIQDNGKGYDFSEKTDQRGSLGEKILLERSKIIESKLKIESEKNIGTTVTLQIPF